MSSPINLRQLALMSFYWHTSTASENRNNFRSNQKLFNVCHELQAVTDFRVLSGTYLHQKRSVKPLVDVSYQKSAIGTRHKKLFILSPKLLNLVSWVLSAFWLSAINQTLVLATNAENAQPSYLSGCSCCSHLFPHQTR